MNVVGGSCSDLAVTDDEILEYGAWLGLGSSQHRDKLQANPGPVDVQKSRGKKKKTEDMEKMFPSKRP